jgi:hypothetical protein
MRILAVVPYTYDTAPGQRYRIEQWEPHLRRLGVHISYAPFESPTLNRIISQPGQMARKSQHVARGLARRFGMLSRVRNYDAVYLYREAAMIGPPIIEKLLAR